jgi:multicomponent Na+:H+ antiporter subunit B
MQMRKLLALLVVLPCLAALVLLAAELPPYGSPDNPANNEVAARYIKLGVEETGAINVVTEILVDYRAYDTLIETTVLFTALVAVLLTLKGDGKHHA